MRKVCPLFISLALAACSAPKGEQALEAKVDAVYERLSVEDRAAQLFGIYPSEFMVDGKFSVEKAREVIPYGAGHICQMSSSQNLNADEIRALIADIQDYLVNETHAGIPAVIHDECISGVTAKGATAYPQQIGVACTWDPDLLSVKMGQTADITFTVSTDQLAWHSEAGWTVSPGDYAFRIGSSSRDLPLEGVCRLGGKPVTKSLRDVYFAETEVL